MRFVLFLALVPTLAIADPALPGKCVRVPRVTHDVDVDGSAINDNGELGHGTTHWKLKTESALDVDGDGVADVFVPIAATKNTCRTAFS